MPFAATWMDLEIVMLSKLSQAEKEKCHMEFLICRIWKKLIQMNLFMKQTHRLREWTYSCQGEEWRGEVVRELGISMFTLLYLKWMTNTAQGTLLNVTWQPGWEESLGENGYMYMYSWVPLLSTWNCTKLLTGYISIWNKRFTKVFIFYFFKNEYEI